MAKKSKGYKKMEKAKINAEKRALKAKAKAEALEKMIDRGWRPKD